jgi:hypothetical protein
MRLILGREEQRGISQLPLIWNLHFGERGKFVTVVTPDEMPFQKTLGHEIGALF